MSPPGVLIAADDRTGALEVAGVAAEALGARVPVLGNVDMAGVDMLGADMVVVDTGTRHVRPAVARRRARALDRVPAARQVHKIDSTLRGNWADELVARIGDGRRPVLLVPALPALGRTCEDGVVLVDGRPVAEQPVGAIGPRPERLGSSRPAVLLAAAGARWVQQLTYLDVERWADDPVGIAVCDARDDAELDLAVSALSGRPDVLLAGTSAVAAPIAREMSRAPSGTSSPAPPVRPRAASCLVVCGSVHPAARDQVAATASCGAHVVVDDVAAGVPAPVPDPAGTVILVPPPMPPDPGRRAAPAAVAASLAGRADELYAHLRPDVVIVIGGDTAAAVLGSAPLQVGGLVEPGAPWATTADGRFVVTRAGGFGEPDALHRLVRATLGP